MNDSIEKNVNNFLYNYINIRDIGWFKSTSNNLGEVGLFLEKKLGKTGGDFCIPDYDSIEIKCINDKNNNISLFSAAPYGSSPFPLKKIAQDYGWPDKNYRKFNKINVVSECHHLNRFGFKYKSFLKVDNRSKIVLNVIKNDKVVTNDVFWDIDELNDKLKRKLNYLAVVTYYIRVRKKEKFFKYGHVEFFKLKDNFDLCSLFENNTIKIKINVGIRKSGKYKGKYCDHGSTFFMQKKDICYLFEKMK